MGCSVLGWSVACVLVLVCSVLLPCFPGGVLVVIKLWLVCCTKFPCREVLLHCYTVFTVRGWLSLLYQFSFAVLIFECIIAPFMRRTQVQPRTPPIQRTN